MRILSFLACLLLTINFLGAQEVSYPQPLYPDLPFTSVKIDNATPLWAKMLYKENPNLRVINELYQEWKTENPTIKNGHTRNLKHYMAFLVSNDAISKEGYAIIPKDTESQKQNWNKKRKQLLKGNSRSTNNWTAVGPILVPETQGRVNAQSNVYAIDQSKSNSDILYCGTETDYVFKTIDKGENWFSVSDDETFGGAMEIEIHPSNPDIVYLGTSHDIMKTTDGGTTWNTVRNESNQQKSSIIINPDNPNIVLAAGNTGLHRTTNGGTTWSTITSTRVYDLKFKSDDPDIVFALYNNATDNVTDFWRSTDGGATWTTITDGWDEPDPSSSNKGGRMTTSDDYPDVIYIFTGASYTTLANPKNGIKIRKSSDAGLSWQLLVDSDQSFTNPAGTSSTIINNGQGFYDWDIEMMDSDTNTVMLGTQGKWLTTNGFSNNVLEAWGSTVGGHSDMQEALFNGTDYWVATDGGIVLCNSNLLGYDIKMNGINCAEFWSFDQGWNRDAQVGSLYHNGTIGSTDSYGPGIFRFFGGAEPEFSALKHPYPDKIISKGYGSVNGRSMPDDFDDPETSFSYNLQPNSNYAIWLTNEESEIEVSPFNYNIHWAGEDNRLMKSFDFGFTWTKILTGRDNAKITKIEVPKSNANIMYVGEYHSSGYAIYKSTDGGESFNALLNTPDIPGNDDDGLFMSCDHYNPDILFIAFRESDNDNDKVWKTEDGGITWSNINTGSDILDGESITDILAISGTNGDLYVTTNHGVFHRTNTDNWVTCLDGLPPVLRIRHIKPFYKEGKVRIGTMNRGVYSLDMINEPTEILVQPTVNNTNGLCNKDTFYFEDYSILNHTDATWSWTFDPAPAFIDDVSIRNPKVVFSNNGTYQAYLTITKNGESYTDTLDQPIELNSLCHPDDFPGQSYKIIDYGDHGEATDPGRMMSEWTVSYWIKPNASQNNTTTLFDALQSSNTRDFCSNFYGNTLNPTMHYKGAGSSAWGTNPGLSAIADEWNHVAYTSSVASGDVTVYVNGESFVYPNVTAQEIAFERMLVGWQYAWWGGRFYQGEMDELAIYDRVLDQDEIRLRMHITKDLSEDSDLIHYYQWNEDLLGTTYDKVNISHMSLPAGKVNSNGPFAGGTSSKLDVTNGGLKEFSSEGLTMTFPSSGTYPNGEVVVTRLNTTPDTSPSDDEGSQNYWVVHNFGSNSTFSALDEITFEGYGSLSSTEAANPSEFELYQRDFGQHSASWGTLIDNPSAIDDDPENIIIFGLSTINSFGQYYITKGDCISGGIVTSSKNDDPGSLRDMLFNACPNDTIYFDSNIDFETIQLSTTSLDITKNVYLKGNGIVNTIIDGDGSKRIFRILDPTTEFGFEKMTLQNASETTDGGALLNYGKLAIKQSQFQFNLEGGIPKALTNFGDIEVRSGTTTIKE